MAAARIAARAITCEERGEEALLEGALRAFELGLLHGIDHLRSDEDVPLDRIPGPGDAAGIRSDDLVATWSLGTSTPRLRGCVRIGLRP